MKTFISLALLTTALSVSLAANAQPRKIHVYESDGNGFNTKNFFYDNGQEIVVFDTQFTPETALKSIAAIRAVSNNPITAVIITHPNPDKFNGMSVFQAHGAKVIASRATVENLASVHAYKKNYFVNVAKMFTEANYPTLGRVDAIFEKSQTLTLRNGEQIFLRELGRPGVSTNQTVAYIPAMQSLMVGDLIHHRAHAWLEGGIVAGKATPTLRDWIFNLRALDALFRARPGTIVYGGRGEAAPLSEAVRAQVRYLIHTDQLVSNYLKNLNDRKSELLGPQAGAHFQALQALLERAFPDYALGYMIQYGVYGLTHSKLKIWPLETGPKDCAHF